MAQVLGLLAPVSQRVAVEGPGHSLRCGAFQSLTLLGTGGFLTGRGASEPAQRHPGKRCPGEHRRTRRGPWWVGPEGGPHSGGPVGVCCLRLWSLQRCHRQAPRRASHHLQSPEAPTPVRHPPETPASPGHLEGGWTVCLLPLPLTPVLASVSRPSHLPPVLGPRGHE